MSQRQDNLDWLYGYTVDRTSWAFRNLIGETASTDASTTAFLQSGTGASTRSVLSKLRELAITPQDFGATGISTTDATNALRNAYSRASSLGADLKLPAGDYLFSGQLGWTGRVNVIGEGQQEKVKLIKSGNFDGILIDGGGQFCVYENFYVEGAAGNTGVGIKIDQGQFIKMRNVYVHGQGSHGIHVTDSLVGRYEEIVCALNGGDGFRMEESGGGAINSCLLLNIHALQNTSTGFNFISGNECRGINIIAEQNQGGGIRVSTGGANQFEVYLESNSTFGLKIQPGATRTDIGLMLDDVIAYQDDGVNTTFNGPGVGSGYINPYGVQPPLPTSGNGRQFTVLGGHAVTSGNGGDVVITGGNAAGAGTAGAVLVNSEARFSTNVSSATVSTGTFFAASLSTANVSTGTVFTGTLAATTNISSATVSTATVYATDVIGATRVSTATLSTASVYAPTLISTAAISTNTLRAVSNLSSATLSTATVFATDIIGATRVSTVTVSTASVYAPTLVSTAAVSTNTLRALTSISSASVSTGVLFASGVVSFTAVTTLSVANSPYTVTATDRYIRCDCSSGAITVLMPAASGAIREIFVKKIDSTASTVTISSVGTDTFDGAVTTALASQWATKGFINPVTGLWERLNTPTI